ncbi:hypothetical protein Tco_0919224 [Tanacetum coccineum]
MGKGLLSPNDKSCSGKGGRGGSMAGSDGGWLSKSLIESNDGRGGGELVVHEEEKIVWTVEMVLVEEKSMVEELSWECSRVCLARFLGGEAGQGLTKLHTRTLILAVRLNSLADFLSLFDFGIVRSTSKPVLSVPCAEWNRPSIIKGTGICRTAENNLF